jgi:tRNA A-37 threonylcarbamoyl transferase component Bud32
VNGYSWKLESEARAALEPLIRRFPDLDALPGVEVLKRNHFRAVFRVPPGVLGAGAWGAGGPGVIAKAYRYTTRWDRLRYRFVRPRAEEEWRALQRFRELGLPTAVALAVGELRHDGVVWGGGLLASYLAGTETLTARLDRLRRDAHAGGVQEIPPAVRRLLTETGGLLARLHDAGVRHRDLHTGNFLVSGPDGSPALHLIDLHTCVFHRRLGRRARRRGIVKLLHSLQMTLPAAWLRPLLDAYGAERLSRAGVPLEALERRLLAAAARLERKRLRSRSKRCFLPSTRFRVVRRPGWRLYHLAEVAPEDLDPCWEPPPPAPAASVRFLKECPAGWVAALEIRGGRRVVVKRRRVSFLEGVQALVESHRLRRAYGNGHALSVRGIPSPQVVALAERTAFGLVRAAWLVTDWVAEAAPLEAFLKARYLERAVRGEARLSGREAREKHILSRRVGRFLARVHDAGLYPHDLAPKNLLVTPAALAEEGKAQGAADGLFLIDLDHLYLWQPLGRRGRRRNLVEAGNLPEGHVSALDRLRALRAYAAASAGGRRFWSRPEVLALRSGILVEHARVLAALLRREERLRPRQGGCP